MHSLRPQSARPLLTLCGIGYVPFAPGTVGSAVTAVGLSLLARTTPYAFWIVLAALLLLWPLALAAIRRLARQTTARVDRPSIVIDELIGMSVTLLPALFTHRTSWMIVTIGFVLFRIFDVLKPLGIKTIDQRNTPVSVLLDDLIAGLYAAAILTVILFVM